MPKWALANSMDLYLYPRLFEPLFREFFGKAALFYSRQNVEFEQFFCWCCWIDLPSVCAIVLTRAKPKTHYHTSNLQRPFWAQKRRWSLVRENQQSSTHIFVKDFSLFFPKICRLCPLKKGAATENPLEYGKTEVQILFEPLQAAISSMELPKNFENKKLPNPLRWLAFLPFHL